MNCKIALSSEQGKRITTTQIFDKLKVFIYARARELCNSVCDELNNPIVRHQFVVAIVAQWKRIEHEKQTFTCNWRQNFSNWIFCPLPCECQTNTGEIVFLLCRQSVFSLASAFFYNRKSADSFYSLAIYYKN